MTSLGVQLDAADVPGLRKAAEILRVMASRSGSTVMNDIERRAWKQGAEQIGHDADAVEREALVALRSGSECADLGRERTEGPDGDTQEAPRVD